VGGFNPTWQRHVAAYQLCSPLLPQGKTLDLGCGVGHSWEHLLPRETVGVDASTEALEGQARPTVVADMRALPFAKGEFESVLSVHSLEHVPDPEQVLVEARRVLAPTGTAVFVTPNRLTFAKADEIIDPYHYVELSPGELSALCLPVFDSVRIMGIFGSARYLEIVAAQKKRLAEVLRMDPLRLRRFVPRVARQRLYDRMLTRARREPTEQELAIEPGDFSLGAGSDDCLDVVAVCSPRPLG
jgi:SAM-dependent methyltransferase